MTDQAWVSRCASGAVSMKPGETLYLDDVEHYTVNALKTYELDTGRQPTRGLADYATMATLGALRNAGREVGVRDDDPHAVREPPPPSEPYNPTDADWIAQYTFIIEPPITVAGQVTIAAAAPGEFLKDTGREPPHDLVARVLAELRRHYPPKPGPK